MVIHFGMKPRRGGNPPRENIRIRIFIISEGFCLISIEIDRVLRFIRWR